MRDDLAMPRLLHEEPFPTIRNDTEAEPPKEFDGMHRRHVDRRQPMPDQVGIRREPFVSKEILDNPCGGSAGGGNSKRRRLH